MWRSIGPVTALALLMVGCGGGGGDGSVMPSPKDLQYAGDTSNTIGVVGTPFGPDNPTVTGTVTQYTVSPALPAGLSLDPVTGAISGTPLTVSPATAYVITASNNGGAARAALTLTVFAPLSGLTYAGPVHATVGTALTDMTPAISGDPVKFSVLPALPAGLVIDPATGVLHGTPTSTRPPVLYTITAIDSHGSSTPFDLSVAVGPPSPGIAATGVFRDFTVTGMGYVSGTHSGLTDEHGQFIYEGGQSVTFQVGNVSLGTVSSPKSLITPVDLMANGTGESNYVLNVVRFLMMLDQDGNPSNGIQISAAVTAAAASWGPVDFDTADLLTVLGPLIQLASTADGMPHTLPDAASAQARLRAEYYCTYSGRYTGSYTGSPTSGDRGDFTVEVLPDGSMHAVASATATPTGFLAGFDVTTVNALNTSLDASFALSSQSPSIALQGSFTDPTFLSGTYLANVAGTFLATGDTATAPTYKFVGTYTRTTTDPPTAVISGLAVFGMNDSNEVSGDARGSLTGTVTGTTFAGTISIFAGYFERKPTYVNYPVAGTLATTPLGYTLEGQYTTGASDGAAVVTFSTVGCRAN